MKLAETPLPSSRNLSRENFNLVENLSRGKKK